MSVLKGDATVQIAVYDDERATQEPLTEYVYLGENSSHGISYKNAIIPEGAKLIIKEIEDVEGFELELVASPVVESTDYMQTYKNYYY